MGHFLHISAIWRLFLHFICNSFKKHTSKIWKLEVQKLIWPRSGLPYQHGKNSYNFAGLRPIDLRAWTKFFRRSLPTRFIGLQRTLVAKNWNSHKISIVSSKLLTSQRCFPNPIATILTKLVLLCCSQTQFWSIISTTLSHQSKPTSKNRCTLDRCTSERCETTNQTPSLKATEHTHAHTQLDTISGNSAHHLSHNRSHSLSVTPGLVGACKSLSSRASSGVVSPQAKGLCVCVSKSMRPCARFWQVVVWGLMLPRVTIRHRHVYAHNPPTRKQQRGVRQRLREGRPSSQLPSTTLSNGL